MNQNCKYLTFFILLIILLPVISSCESKQDRLVIFAASSLSNVYSEMINGFSHLNPDIDIKTSYASSTALRIQIEAGAIADIYASANPDQADLLESQGLLVPNSKIYFASNKMGVAYNFVEQGKFSLETLSQPGLRIVMALLEVPAGAYAFDALTLLNAEFGPRYSNSVLANVVSYENSVRQALLKVEIGEADAAFVYASDVLVTNEAHFFLFPDFAQPDIQYIAAVVSTEQSQDAQKFLDYLLSPEGQKILEKWGFKSP